jgi:hypothetical protein
MSKRSSEPRHVRLPGFLVTEEVGLGDAVKRVTTALGVAPCGGCRRRAESLNRRILLYGRGSGPTSNNSSSPGPERGVR